VFTAPLRSNGRGAGHRKHRSSVAVPLLLSCLLLRERVSRAVAWKRLWYICLSRCRCIVTALHTAISSTCFKVFHDEIFEAFTANKCATILSGYQPCQCRSKNQCFRDVIGLHHGGSLFMLILLLDFCTEWVWTVFPRFQRYMLPPSSGLSK
jgi:hypothetical protein